MEESEGIQAWAKKVKLPAAVVSVLEESGFTTVDEISALSPAEIKEAFQDTGLLNIAQCLALKRAVASLQGPPPTHTPPHPFSAAAAATSSPQPHPNTWTSTDPRPSSSSSAFPSPFSQPPYHVAPPGSQPPPYTQTAHPPYPADQPHPHPQPHPHQQPHPPYPSQPGYYPQAGPAGMVAAGAYGPPQPQPQQPQPQASGSTMWGGGRMEVDACGKVAECFRFLLLGKTGSGKSTTGNTIFGERLFNTAATFSSVTSDCERKTNTRGGRKVEILDSPGLYDTHKSQEEIGVIIVQAVAGMHPGPHAILYVVRLGRYTPEEHGAYQRLKALFDDSITRYMIVVFTYGDMLEREGRSIGDLIGPSAPQTLQQVLRECGNRHVVFNNMAADSRPQVEHLLGMVRQLVQENGGRPYSCPKYTNIGQGMEEEVARRLQEVEKRDLQRQKYVQQLERQTQEAEESARRTQEQFQKNEEERQRQMEAEEEKRRQLEEQLHSHIKEQQIGFERYQQELQRLHEEREEQERLMKEKKAQMSEIEKKRAEEQAQQMRQREEEMQAMLAQHEERLTRQKQEDEERRQRMEEERQEFLKYMEEQRRKEIEELEKRNEEREKLWEKQRQEEREAAERRAKNYEKEMEELKGEVVANRAASFINACASAIRNFVYILAEVRRTADSDPYPYLGQGPARRPIMSGRNSPGVPH